MNSIPKAVLYLRVSTDRQAEEGTSLETQELACLKKAAALGAQVVGTYRDDGVSGALYLSRPGIQDALRMLESGEANLLITMKLDRSGRDADVLGAIRKRVTNAGAELIFADGMNFENNASGNLMFRVSAGFAEYEKEVIRERTTGGRKKRAESGLQPSRTISPYGYHVVTKPDVLLGHYPPEQLGRYQIVEEKAKWAREIFARYHAGLSRRQIKKWLESQGVPSPEGCAEWSSTTITRMIAHPCYMGRPVWGRTQRKVDESRISAGKVRTDYTVNRNEGEWIYLSCEPLVSEEVWQACQERIQTNKNRRGNPRRKYMLTGLVFCPHCKRRLGGMRTAAVRYYRCPHDRGCPYTNINAEQLENAYDTRLLAFAREPELATKIVRSYERQSNGENHTEAICRLRQDLETLDRQEMTAARAQVEAMMQGRNTAVYDTMLAEIGTKRTTLQERLKAIEAQAAQSVQPRTAEEKIRETLADLEEILTATDLDTGKKNELLRLVTHAIYPDPEPGAYSIWLQPIVGHSKNGAEVLIRVSVCLTDNSVKVDIVDMGGVFAKAA